VERLTEEGQRLAELLEPGDLLGLEGLLAPPASAFASSSASGRAMEAYTLTEVALIRFGREDLLRGLSHPPLRDHLLRRLGEALDRWRRRCEWACYRGVRDRLIAELLELARRFGTQQEGQLLIPLPLRKHLLEKLVGAGHTRVTVERRKLEEAGLLRFSKEGIWLPDPARLARVVGDAEGIAGWKTQV
jgi:CRP-like cAMP-binding protein